MLFRSRVAGGPVAAARAAIEEDQLRPAFKMLARVARAQQQLIQSWDVLSTMTPHDYSAIRPHLGASSGFQSPQYRMMEFMLGGHDAKHVRLHKDNADWADRLEAERGRASLYDAAIRLLARRGFAIDDAALAPLRGIPQLMVWGDHLDAHPLWSQLRPRLRAFAQRLRQWPNGTVLPATGQSAAAATQRRRQLAGPGSIAEFQQRCHAIQ